MPFPGCVFIFGIPYQSPLTHLLTPSPAFRPVISAAAMSFLSALYFRVSRPTLHIVRTATAFLIWVPLGCVACL